MLKFDGFSPDSFEQLVRALALKVFGPGVTIFGNGPDGGREASFTGNVPYPFPPTTIWSGYGVIQAKFKEKPEGTKNDTNWVKTQLESELDRWKTSVKRNPKPKYYVFCTNVELSSAKNGGKELVAKILEDNQSGLGLKDYAIWDANQLSSLIDGYSEIRQRFQCFFTPGDLLAKFAGMLKSTTDPESSLASYLCRELAADEDAKLSQAGDRSEDRIRLAKVFVDLPSSALSGIELHDDDEEIGASLQQMLRVSTYRLDPVALFEDTSVLDKSTGKDIKLYGRYLFLGGPGSGKSTIGQFLAQIHRAALLSRRPPHRLEWKIKQIIEEIRERCQTDGVSWPGTPRFPFRIDLNNFARAIADGANPVTSLSEYIRRGITPDGSFTHADLREILRSHPSLLILDGLDEVPASSNRREVIDAVQDFLNEARDLEADLMIVASSRPEGYGGELDGEELAHRFLTPLSKARALACAERYVRAKIAVLGEERGREAMSTISSAIENPLIEKLMRSPLQVTFMVTVVAASGKPSDSRWQLFNDYYRIIYERELHKAVRPFSQVLNTRRQDIDALHHKVGFILQCRAESRGGTQADLSKGEFEQLVHDCLEENGLEKEDLAAQSEMILGAANTRLVFLTSRTPGRLSFDVRSLQEYMAAACITDADSTQSIRTLETIAHTTYWRNTLLFAVGRFFVEPQMRAHRHKIRLFCEDLNLRDNLSSSIKLGSWVALDILESGTVGNVPLISRSLVNCALDLLALNEDLSSVAQRLAEVYDPIMAPEYEAKIRLMLGQVAVEQSFGAWHLALELEKREVQWAAELCECMWPSNAEVAWEILERWIMSIDDYEDLEARDVAERAILSSFDTIRLRNIVFKVSPAKFLQFGFPIRLNVQHPDAPWLQELFDWFSGEYEKPLRANIILDGRKEKAGIMFKRLPTEQVSNLFAALPTYINSENCHREWEIISALSIFNALPNSASLASTLEKMAELDVCSLDMSPYLIQICWVVRIFLKASKSRSELLDLSTQAANGSLGDIEIWNRLQNDWASEGISAEALQTPFFNSSATLGAGVNYSAVGNLDHNTVLPFIKDLSNIITSEKNYNVKRFFIWFATQVVTRTNTLHELDPVLLKSEWLGVANNWHSQSLKATDSLAKVASADWYDFFDELGKLEQVRFSSYLWRDHEMNSEFYLNGFNADPSRFGLLRLLGFACAAGLLIKGPLPSLINTIRFSPQFELFVILIRIAGRDPLSSADAESIAARLPDLFEEQEEVDAPTLLISALEHHASRVPSLVIVLDSMFKTLKNQTWDLETRMATLRRAMYQAQPSGLDEQKLAELGLPSLFIGSVAPLTN